MKEKKSLQDRLKALDKLAENINKANDYPIVGRLSTTPELKENLKVEYIPTQSFNLNEIMGGGIPKAKITIVCGKEDSGNNYFCFC